MTIRSAWRGTRQRWLARLRRDRAGVAWLVLLTLGWGEPLLCIFHCQFWLPIMFHDYFAAQHHHHHYVHQAVVPAAAQAVLVTSAADSQRGLPLPQCMLQRGGGPDAPFHVPPSPVHEMLSVLVPVLVVLLLIVVWPAAPQCRLLTLSIPPPLRPPISFAG